MAASYNISARRQLEQDLRRAQAQLDGVLAAAEVGLWAWRISDGLVQHDLNFARLFALPEGTVSAGQVAWQRIDPQDHAGVRAAVDSALQTGQFFAREFRIVDDSGVRRWLSGRGRLQRDAAGQPEVMNGLVIDISDLKKLEDSLLASDRHKDHFLAVLAHELRDPLAPLLNATKLLGSEGLDAGQLAWCKEIITRQVQRMAVLLDDLFNLSAIKYGRLRMELGTFPLQRAIEAAVESALPNIQARQQQLTVDVPPAPLLLRADVGRIGQVLTNLLTNAAKYSPPGAQIRLAARRLAPVVAGSGMAEQIEITVQDTGIGLDARDRERIFDMFSQVVSPTHPGPGGMGIGLALVKGLVELHGGRVQVDSEGLGRGSVFTVVLPALPEGAAVPEAGAGPVTGVQARRVLIAEDNTDAADSLAMLLRMAGHVPHTVGDGLAALAACAEFDPQVALLDIGLPGLSGYDVAKQLRADPARAGLMLVAVTGWGSAESREQARLAGFDVCLTKPVDPDVLLQLLAGAGPTPAE